MNIKNLTSECQGNGPVFFYIRTLQCLLFFTAYNNSFIFFLLLPFSGLKFFEVHILDSFPGVGSLLFLSMLFHIHCIYLFIFVYIRRVSIVKSQHNCIRNYVSASIYYSVVYIRTCCVYHRNDICFFMSHIIGYNYW